MGKLMRNVVITVKEESTPGVDANPTSLANSILARVSDVQPAVGEFVDRQNIQPYLGSSGKVPVSISSTIDVEFELAGTAAAGDVPGWSALLKACGFDETVVASTSVTYDPVSTGLKTVSIYYYLDGLLHKMTSCRGNPVFTINSRGIPTVAVKFTGLYVAPTDTSLPTDSDFSAFLQPQAVNKVNTTSFTLHGFAGVTDTLTIDMGNQIAYRNMINLEEVSLTDRTASGNASIEMTTIASKAWHEAVRLGTLDAMTLVHGSGAGKTFTISAPKVQLTNPSYSEKDGIAMLGLGLDLQPNTGNDEISIAIT